MNDHSIGFVGDVMSIKLSSVTMVPNPIKPYLSRNSLITSLNLNQIVNIQIIMLWSLIWIVSTIPTNGLVIGFFWEIINNWQCTLSLFKIILLKLVYNASTFLYTSDFKLSLFRSNPLSKIKIRHLFQVNNYLFAVNSCMFKLIFAESKNYNYV